MHQPSTITEIVTSQCRLLGFSPRTAESYGFALRQFERWSGLPAMAASQEQAAAWTLAAGGTLFTLHCRRHALGFLFTRLRGEEIDSRVLPSPRTPPVRPVDVPDPQEIAAILAAMPNPEHRLFCRFVYGTGLRFSEAVAVRIEDLDPRAGMVLVRHGKGGGQRRSILPESLCRDLGGRIATRLRGSLLFLPPVCAIDNLSEALRHARRRAGIARRVTMHSLRHAFATHLHERGVGIGELRHLLGHSSIQTTMHYIGLRELRRTELARIGDLLAALPAVDPGQQRIAFS